MRKKETENVCFALRFYVSKKLSNDKNYEFKIIS